MSETHETHVVIVGAGFAGLGCARALAKHRHVRVTLIDRNDYHQFQPLLYQVATAQLARADVAFSLHELFHRHPNVEVVVGDVAAVDPGERSATLADGSVHRGDALVVAAGAHAHFFDVPGAAEHAFPLYTIDHADRLRGQIVSVFDAARDDPSLVDEGALTFVVVGAGATGTEIAGALSEMIAHTMRAEYPELDTSVAQVMLVDHGDAVLGPFSEHAHEYAAEVLRRDGVELRLGTGVKEVGPGHAVLSDDTRIPTRTVIWGGGVRAVPLAADSGLETGRGGRVPVLPDLTLDGYPGVYVLGDLAAIPGPEGGPLPQLGSVALQSGQWTARNILADAAGKPRRPFHYKDKGIMAMIGHNSAVAEMGAGRHEVHGSVAFLMWLGVHATLMTGVRPKVDAFMDWAWDYFSPTRTSQPLDRSGAPRIDWSEGKTFDPTPEAPGDA